MKKIIISICLVCLTGCYGLPNAQWRMEQAKQMNENCIGFADAYNELVYKWGRGHTYAYLILKHGASGQRMLDFCMRLHPDKFPDVRI